MNKQEIFNQSYTFIMKQGEPALHKDWDTCWYRLPNGHRCAVGALMNDKEIEQYGDSGRRLTSLLAKDTEPTPFGRAAPRVFRQFFFEHTKFLLELQSAHDTVASEFEYELDDDAAPPFIERFDRMMRKVAEKYNLSVPEID